jgi:hypothetical protein
MSTLLSFWLFDIWVFSQWWLYAPLLIPAFFYTIFFFIKWIVLTAPIWLPISLAVKGLIKIRNQK